MTTKRTRGPCTCGKNIITGQPWHTGPDLKVRYEHNPDCPSLSPAQQEPDALTRLCKLVRQRWTVDADDRPITDVLDLISEAREEQRRADATWKEATGCDNPDEATRLIATIRADVLRMS